MLSQSLVPLFNIWIHLYKYRQRTPFIFISFLVLFLSYYFNLSVPPPRSHYFSSQEHLLHMQALDRRAQETNLEHWLNPHCYPRCDRNYGYPHWWRWRQRSPQASTSTPNHKCNTVHIRSNVKTPTQGLIICPHLHKHLEWQISFLSTCFKACVKSSSSPTTESLSSLMMSSFFPFAHWLTYFYVGYFSSCLLWS